MKDQEDIQELFEDKYEARLDMSYQNWLQHGPQTEDAAYNRLAVIDQELKNSYEQWFNAQGETKDLLEEKRDKLKAEYDLIEEIFGLELSDR
jgi:hypothetical protein